MYWIYSRPLYGKAFHATQNVYSESCNPVWPGSVFPEWPGQARHSMQPRNDCFSGLLPQWARLFTNVAYNYSPLCVENICLKRPCIPEGRNLCESERTRTSSGQARHSMQLRINLLCV